MFASGYYHARYCYRGQFANTQANYLQHAVLGWKRFKSFEVTHYDLFVQLCLTKRTAVIATVKMKFSIRVMLKSTNVC